MAASSFRFGDFRLDTRRRSLERGDERLELQPKVYDTLLHFVRNADRVITKDELLRDVWAGAVVTEDVLTRVVSALRKVLGDEAGSPRFIRAVRGVGYCFVAAVESEEETAVAAGRPRSLAVLPFRAVSTADRDESLELGMADTLIARLGVLSELVVRPLDSTRACLAEGRTALDVARALDVDAVLEASLQAGGDRLRVNARLLSVEDGRSLWTESFDERFADVFELQDAICDRIVAALLPHLGDVTGAAARVGSTTPAAYREFLEGRVFMARHTPADIRLAMERFEAALDAAPTHAEAWASLGDCHELLATESEDDAGAHYLAAGRAARRALALAPGLPEAECLLAKIAWQHEWDWARAEAGFRRAIDRCPNRADLHIHFADYCCMIGRAEHGVEHALRALAIDPVSPWCSAILAQALYMSGRFEAAVNQAERTLELAPGFPFACLFAGLAAYCGGDRDRGIDYLEQATRFGRRDVQAALALCYAQVGRRDDALTILRRLQDRGGAAPPFARAVASWGCGDRAAALACLEECVRRRHWQVLLLRSDPLFAKLRSDKRLRGILERAGLPPL